MEGIFEVNGPIDSWGCQTNWVRYNLNKCKGENVTMRVNSPGGVISEAMSIAQAIKDHGNVTVILTGCCASAATWMGLGANSVKIAEDALWMCHNSSSLVDVFQSMKAKDIDSLIKELESQKKSQECMDANIAKMYSAKSSKNIEDIISLMSEEKWMNADDVKEWGFVDEIVPGSIPMSKAVRDQMIQNCAAFNLPAPQFHEVEDNEESLVQRILNGVKDLFKSKDTIEDDGNGNIVDLNHNKNSESMKTIINSVTCFLTLLNMKEIEATDNNVTLSVDQLNAIESALADAKAQTSAMNEVIEALNSVSEDVKAIDGAKNKVNAIKAILNRTPAFAPAQTQVPAEPKSEKNDGEDPVNNFFNE